MPFLTSGLAPAMFREVELVIVLWCVRKSSGGGVETTMIHHIGCGTRDATGMGPTSSDTKYSH